MDVARVSKAILIARQLSATHHNLVEHKFVDNVTSVLLQVSVKNHLVALLLAILVTACLLYMVVAGQIINANLVKFARLINVYIMLRLHVLIVISVALDSAHIIRIQTLLKLATIRMDRVVL